MFEDSIKDYPSRLTFWFCVGGLPFGVAYAYYRSLVPAFVLEVYLITMSVFVLDPFQTRKERAKHWWYWKIMLSAGAVVHPLVLINLWFLDVRHPVFITGATTVILMAVNFSMVEIVILAKIVNRLKPPDQEQASGPGVLG